MASNSTASSSAQIALDVVELGISNLTGTELQNTRACFTDSQVPQPHPTIASGGVVHHATIPPEVAQNQRDELDLLKRAFLGHWNIPVISPNLVFDEFNNHIVSTEHVKSMIKSFRRAGIRSSFYPVVMGIRSSIVPRALMGVFQEEKKTSKPLGTGIVPELPELPQGVPIYCLAGKLRLTAARAMVVHYAEQLRNGGKFQSSLNIKSLQEETKEAERWLGMVFDLDVLEKSPKTGPRALAEIVTNVPHFHVPSDAFEDFSNARKVEDPTTQHRLLTKRWRVLWAKSGPKAYLVRFTDFVGLRENLLPSELLKQANSPASSWAFEILTECLDHLAAASNYRHEEQIKTIVTPHLVKVLNECYQQSRIKQMLNERVISGSSWEKEILRMSESVQREVEVTEDAWRDCVNEKQAVKNLNKSSRVWLNDAALKLPMFCPTLQEDVFEMANDSAGGLLVLAILTDSTYTGLSDHLATLVWPTVRKMSKSSSYQDSSSVVSHQILLRNSDDVLNFALLPPLIKQKRAMFFANECAKLSANLWESGILSRDGGINADLRKAMEVAICETQDEQIEFANRFMHYGILKYCPKKRAGRSGEGLSENDEDVTMHWKNVMAYTMISRQLPSQDQCASSPTKMVAAKDILLRVGHGIYVRDNVLVPLLLDKAVKLHSFPHVWKALQSFWNPGENVERRIELSEFGSSGILMPEAEESDEEDDEGTNKEAEERWTFFRNNRGVAAKPQKRKPSREEAQVAKARAQNPQKKPVKIVKPTRGTGQISVTKKSATTIPSDDGDDASNDDMGSPPLALAPPRKSAKRLVPQESSKTPKRKASPTQQSSTQDPLETAGDDFPMDPVEPEEQPMVPEPSMSNPSGMENDQAHSTSSSQLTQHQFQPTYDMRCKSNEEQALYWGAPLNYAVCAYNAARVMAVDMLGMETERAHTCMFHYISKDLPSLLDYAFWGSFGHGGLGGDFLPPILRTDVDDVDLSKRLAELQGLNADRIPMARDGQRKWPRLHFTDNCLDMIREPFQTACEGLTEFEIENGEAGQIIIDNIQESIAEFWEAQRHDANGNLITPQAIALSDAILHNDFSESSRTSTQGLKKRSKEQSELSDEIEEFTDPESKKQKTR